MFLEDGASWIEDRVLDMANKESMPILDCHAVTLETADKLPFKFKGTK